MKPTLRQLFLTEAPFAADPVGPPAPDAEFDEFDEFEPEDGVSIEVLPPGGGMEDCGAPEEDFMPFGTLAPLAGFEAGEETDEFGEPEEPVRGAGAEEVEEFEDELGPSARTAPSGRAFEGLDPAKRPVQEATSFDRFMDKIIIQESTSIQRPDTGLLDSAQRKRAMSHQERPLGRIRYTRGK